MNKRETQAAAACFDQLKGFNDLDEQLQKDVIQLSVAWGNHEPNPIIALHRVHISQVQMEARVATEPSKGLITLNNVAVMNNLCTLLLWWDDRWRISPMMPN